MSESTVAARAGRYLVFVLGGGEYCIDVLKVREIIGPLPVTRVPRMPDTVRGVINLRGKIIPVIDLRVRFDLEAVDHGARTCMIVVQMGGAELAAVVDRVCEVATITEADIEDTPAFGGSIDTAYLLGVAKTGTRVRLLLDVERALAQHERSALGAIAHEQWPGTT
jgi:purine-binding chemotaxis protein CheW